MHLRSFPRRVRALPVVGARVKPAALPAPMVPAVGTPWPAPGAKRVGRIVVEETQLGGGAVGVRIHTQRDEVHHGEI